MKGMFLVCIVNWLNLVVIVNINFCNIYGIEIFKIIKFVDICFMMLIGNKDGWLCVKFW